jgi:hypothetical protein
VSGGENAAYDNLIDGLMSTFHHELFHNLQQNISQHYGQHDSLGGAGGAWEFFSEGTAVLASSIAQRDVQFAPAAVPRAYMANAGNYLGGSGLLTDLNRSYTETSPYRASLYWRFLYEQTGGLQNGVEDPASGLKVIKKALTILYSGQVVDINSSTDLVGYLPQIMDRALADSSTSPFHTYRESLVAFAQAVYQMRLDDGPFYDPFQQYPDTPVAAITYSGSTLIFDAVSQPYPAGIRASYGFDIVEVTLDPAAAGRPLSVELLVQPGAAAQFQVQILGISSAADGQQQIQLLTTLERGRPVMDGLDTNANGRLVLIITRLDSKERIDAAGAYTLRLKRTNILPSAGDQARPLARRP